MAKGEHPNCDAIDAFLTQLTVARPIVATERLDGKKVRNGYTASYWDAARGVGFTAVAWGVGQFKVTLECAGSLEKAQEFGRRIARAVEGGA